MLKAEDRRKGLFYDETFYGSVDYIVAPRNAVRLLHADSVCGT